MENKTERTVFKAYADLGASFVSDATSLDDDARRITGLRFQIEIEYADDMPYDTPMRFNPVTRNIEINTDRQLNRSEAAQAMAEELLHAVDVISQNRALSAASKRLDLKTGDLALEAKRHFDDNGIYGPFLLYPFDPFYGLTKSRTQAELFARLGAMYFGEQERMRQTLPLAYGVYHELFRDTAASPVTGERIRGKVWANTSKPGEVGGGLRSNRGDLSRNTVRTEHGQAHIELGRLRDATAKALASSRFGGILQASAGLENRSSDNSDTRYSRTSGQTSNAPKSNGHPAGWLLGLFQRNHIIDMYGKELPELAQYKTLTRNRESFVQNMAQEADALYRTYHEKLDQKKAEQLGEVQTVATVAEYEPDPRAEPRSPRKCSTASADEAIRRPSRSGPRRSIAHNATCTAPSRACGCRRSKKRETICRWLSAKS